MKQKGKIVRWNKDRGFGFIAPASSGEDVFIHISALNNRSRIPNVGDVIFYDTATESDGRLRAENAQIEGDNSKPVKKRAKKWAINPLEAIFLMLGVFAAFYLYQTNSSDPLPMPAALHELFKKEDSPKFYCVGKQHCSQMISCKEAKFYLRNCPNVKIDGDNDGVPCERQLCN